KQHAPDLAKALKQAEADGIVAPHEIHQLMAEAGGTMLDGQPGLRAFKAIWGSMFALAESVNRRMTYIAAFETATQEKIKDPYQFAEKAVQETQGLYNRGNRPNWARGVLGATVFTFKQYSISYLEMFKRMDRQGQVIALAVLLLAAGLQGLPFAEDIQDLIDTLGRFMGFNTDSEASLRRAVMGSLGKTIGGVVLDGASAMPGMPLDVQGRLGLGNLLPGTRLLTPFENNKTDDIAQFAGPVGGLMNQAGKAFGNLASGDVAAAFGAITPVALQNIAKG
ncbi:PLxRFG domain-containing protein, partial [Chitinimonas sp. BJB300]|uniref:PLxRFG domain-containing protein n=1 Tax=Chitinimonas sp. BJB300 TaxID=1559339 RepID=UPI001183548D